MFQRAVENSLRSSPLLPAPLLVCAPFGCSPAIRQVPRQPDRPPPPPQSVTVDFSGEKNCFTTWSERLMRLLQQ